MDDGKWTRLYEMVSYNLIAILLGATIVGAAAWGLREAAVYVLQTIAIPTEAKPEATRCS